MTTPEQRARELVSRHISIKQYRGFKVNECSIPELLEERIAQALREKDEKLKELEIALAKAEEALKDLRNGKA